LFVYKLRVTSHYNVFRILFIEVLVPRQIMNGQVFACWNYRFCLFLRFIDWILDLSRRCGIFYFSFYFRSWLVSKKCMLCAFDKTFQLKRFRNSPDS